ncbi:hypothetical protein CIL05_12595 [Virgibacillus profundi]|uniref:YppF-like protein n=1 Tax=Virgibacillus profundi TaxID=2024555 RepID=A0A2A2IBX1_9BACI|nr:YppF family protein [Virgibacillus profundi]PAV29229.1 hypothetical protein CIL05_12595 [Virgibacillus profundi]PXY53398.1 hypothetical protein CIT14_12720 [Virgibacillus profundi]
MLINEITSVFESQHKQSPESVNDLLDYYQKKYIAEEIDIKDYRRIYFQLHKQGAVSAHEYA